MLTFYCLTDLCHPSTVKASLSRERCLHVLLCLAHSWRNWGLLIRCMQSWRKPLRYQGSGGGGGGGEQGVEGEGGEKRRGERPEKVGRLRSSHRFGMALPCVSGDISKETILLNGLVFKPATLANTDAVLLKTKQHPT